MSNNFGDRNIIPKTWEVPEEFHLGVGKVAGRQKLVQADGHILLVLHDLPKLGDDAKRQRAFFWRSTEGEWKSSSYGRGVSSLEKHVSHYAEAVEDLDDDLDESDDAGDYLRVLRVATPLHRASRNMLNVLEELRDLVPDDLDIMHLRDQVLGLERATEFIASDARHGMDFCIAESSAAQAEASHAAQDEARVLNRLVAFFFPVATLAAIGGMNPPSEVFGSARIWLVLAIGLLAGFLIHSSNLFSKYRVKRRREENEDE